MWLEPVRMVADWLEHPVYGVNAILATVPIEAGDAAPPPVQDVRDETRDDDVAGDRLPTGVSPVLAVTAYTLDAITGQVSQGQRDFRPTILVRFGIREPRKARANTVASYIYRAAVRSLHALHENANVAARTRNGIHVYDCAEMRIIPALQPLEGSTASGGIIVTYNARDNTLSP